MKLRRHGWTIPPPLYTSRPLSTSLSSAPFFLCGCVFQDRLLRAGHRVLGATFHLLGTQQLEATWRRGSGQKFRKGAWFVVSREGAETSKHAIEVVSRTHSAFRVDSTSRLPSDFMVGVWCLDLVNDDEPTLDRLLAGVRRFSTAAANCFQTLIIGDVGGLDGLQALNKVNLSREFSDSLETRVRCCYANMNRSQIEAVLQCFRHRLCLVQGPPGTGKTSTAAASEISSGLSGTASLCV